MMTDEIYQQKLSAYAAELRTFFAPEVAPGVRVTRGWPTRAENLAGRGERLVQMGRELGEATASRLSHPEETRREEAQVRLLAQANAQLEVAHGLLAAAETSEPGGEPAKVRGWMASVDVRQSLERLADVLEQPLAPSPAIREAKVSTEIGVRTSLLNQAESTINSIVRQTSRVGLQAVRNLLSLDPEILAQGVSLISQEAGALIAKLGDDVNQLVRRLVLSAVQLILQAYDWVLALIGKDGESQIRQQVQQWIEELRKEKEAGAADEGGLFEKMVNRVFDVQGITRDVAGWINAATAADDQLQELNTKIAHLSKSYEALANQAENFLKLLGLAGTAALLKRIPQFAVLVVAIETTLLGYILYTGYDHIDSNRLQFLDRVKGVRELCMTLAPTGQG